jgi:8-oxo-dGTP diphosphatase
VEKIPTILVVAAALVDASGRVLLQRRAPGRAMAGLWEFPGGKIEPGERAQTALARELAEELGIAVDPEALEPAAFASADGADGASHMLLLLFLCRSWRGSPRPLDADALKWLRPAQMDAGEMPPADRPLIDRLAALV